jgi:hypothetical protein
MTEPITKKDLRAVFDKVNSWSIPRPGPLYLTQADMDDLLRLAEPEPLPPQREGEAEPVTLPWDGPPLGPLGEEP